MSTQAMLDESCFIYAVDVFLRPNARQLEVQPQTVHDFLVGLTERGDRGFDHLLIRLRESISQR